MKNTFYLIEFFYEEDIKDVLEAYYLAIFEEELRSWNFMKNEWPEDRSIDIFLDWFEVKFCDEINDLGKNQIEIEETNNFYSKNS